MSESGASREIIVKRDNLKALLCIGIICIIVVSESKSQIFAGLCGVAFFMSCITVSIPITKKELIGVFLLPIILGYLIPMAIMWLFNGL